MKKIVQTAGRNQLGDFAPDFAHLQSSTYPEASCIHRVK